ncbi:type IV pilus modification PilV family protein [Idiomarina xiamenensis]|uniref:Prepilin-type cleavage/methylation-like protein n=1 Tax=Idiomarina xiamenensis 10-D-4 TaxID=740709 RepID=K2KSK2_9GAMM|nr:type II secretion system protein [Idiomarina xiamenensis]EKE85399.1 prepilin-type cleavage/methylation-like protein [Idiomarina xiamenensis 10-D-4]
MLARGFTLIEIIVGIVVMAIIGTVVTAGMMPLFRQSVDPWQQVRAAELGQSLMNDIMARSYDENSDRSGGQLRCGENTAPSCSASMGPEAGESRADYNDVDDYHGLQACDAAIADILGNSLASDFSGFCVNVSVAETQSNRSKLIQIAVTTPTNEIIRFASYRGNW